MATYKGILTNNGKALIAGATVSNKINYSHIAVGDGNGSVPVPSETRTALINEKARIALNVVEINPNNTDQIVCEAIIPSNVGGFYIRELGLYAGNTMVVNASYPPTYKPLADEGGAREIAIKIVINIQNAEVIALYLDDSLIYATREWVNENYIHRNELIDNLTTDDASKPLTAKQGKVLNDNKLEKTANAVSASKLQTPRNIAISGAVSGSANFDGSGNITINTISNNAIGIGQTWQDVASQRANNTIYVNTTGKPIQVFICVNVSGQYDNSGTFAIDNVVMTIRDAVAWSHLSFIVPSGSSYKISVDSSQYSLLSWTELR
ncbi:phage tail protein [Acinetobacter baumannii]|uniref:phage tail protein n=1 Tax=Acinetobacter baumannii TaxID=470 RepID=UPI001D17302F|nr:phage tail protein [Acinetobacter baumannii]